MKTKTELALLARGVDAGTARSIASKGFSLGRLLQESAESLKGMGVTDDLVFKLLTEKRPPIPIATVNSLLYKCARTCCVCREKSHPIIIHHLSEWSISRSHAIDNLAVLCLNCHGKAHSKSTISLNLTTKGIAHAKSEWEKRVNENETCALFTQSSWNVLSGTWDYFNHNRIVDTFLQLGLDPKKVAGYDVLSAHGLVDLDGGYIWPASAPRKEDLPYMYDGGSRSAAFARSQYYANLVGEILLATSFVDLSNNFTKSSARNLLKVNEVVCVTGGHRFKRCHKPDKTGPGQMRVGYRQGNGLKLSFNFDAWETTSSSSHYSHLKNLWRCTSISIVRSVTFGNKINTVNCTCLAIGTGFTEYSGYAPSVAYRNDYEEYDDDFDRDEYDDEVA